MPGRPLHRIVTTNYHGMFVDGCLPTMGLTFDLYSHTDTANHLGRDAADVRATGGPALSTRTSSASGSTPSPVSSWPTATSRTALLRLSDARGDQLRQLRPPLRCAGTEEPRSKISGD